MPSGSMAGRRAGALIPLFSIPSSRSWGIGEMADLPAFADWLRQAGLSALQLLPLNEMSAGQTSPYSALSAMALDPIYIALPDVPEFQALGGEASFSADDRQKLAAARSARTVKYRTVRELKNRCLRRAFDAFVEREWRRDTARAGELRAFAARERWWLEDYALYRALHEEREGRHWVEWEPPLRARDRSALDSAQARLEQEILYRIWLQWI